jgi:hypothetical protein
MTEEDRSATVVWRDVCRIKTTRFFALRSGADPSLAYRSMLDHGVWVEVKVGEEHLRFFAEHNALGVQASVYNVVAKKLDAPSEPLDDLEQAKERDAPHTRQYLKRVANLELPPLRWKESRSA